MTVKPHIAIIGAGIAGSICARTLHDRGFPVSLFDKGRKPGGRMSTRRSDEAAFDHGAQYFVARHPVFRECVEAWLEHGLVQPWPCRVATWDEGQTQPAPSDEQWFVGAPSMSQIVRHLCEGLQVVSGSPVTEVSREGGKPRVRTEAGDEHVADIVLYALPAPQALTIAHAPGVREGAAKAEYIPNWTLMVTVSEEPALSWDALRVHGSPLAWIARNHTKPGRDALPCYVAQASPRWAFEHIEVEAKDVTEQLMTPLLDLTGLRREAITHATSHRWRYALVSRPLGVPCIWDGVTGACGDWFLGAKVEDAFLSGVALANQVFDSLAAAEQP